MTPEQIQQQKIMKIMMVVMFPVMLYSAPSGLTLYIFTSSLFGIMQSKYIRAHITEMDLKPAEPKKKTAAQQKPRYPQARARADAIARAKKRLETELKPMQQQGSPVPQLKRKEATIDSPQGSS